MKITVSLEEETYRRVRVIAAERDTSVSALVKRFLLEFGSDESETERLKRQERELRERFGPWPEPTEWLLRMAELRLLAARWHIATVHLEEVLDKSVGPLDVVLGYRNPRRIKRLAEQSRGRLRIVDQNSAYFRLAPKETEPEVLYARLKDLLRLPVPSL